VTGLEQARIDQELKTEGISNINVVQAPTFAPKPSQPKKALTLILGMAASVIGAFGTMLLSHHLDQSLKTSYETELALGIPVLASIPRVAFDMERISSQPRQEGHLTYAQS
jgi:polysaccharide biosynthesis transport protein